MKTTILKNNKEKMSKRNYKKKMNVRYITIEKCTIQVLFPPKKDSDGTVYYGFLLEDIDFMDTKKEFISYGYSFVTCIFQNENDEFPWKEGDIVDVTLEIRNYLTGKEKGKTFSMITKMSKTDGNNKVVSYERD